ncbi:hypothetical protein [Vibrio lentus]|uniref:hypothetical protein n=1 Tax=Vibrio lentus TaxID=136468 RepID=UPI000C83F09C|nr:hypothetical protein [Vibrio lentus]PMH89818.1 hypothetical protein BCU56_19095 [Vibrio lentus]
MENESKSIKKLKNELIKTLPFFPNDKETLMELKSQKLSDVMFFYLNWASRQIPHRRRKVHRYTELTSDRRYKGLKDQIAALLEKASNGDDLSLFLSDKANKKGYTPMKRILEGKADSDEDKDKVLNTKGFHHFHLKAMPNRTDEVLFARVTRTEFHAIAIFDHSVFNPKKCNESLEPEIRRMWDIHKKYATMGMPTGSGFMPTKPLSMSGHPVGMTFMTDYYMEIINQYDALLTERSFINDLYQFGNIDIPKKFKLEWKLNALDLVILDKKNNVSFVAFEWDL